MIRVHPKQLEDMAQALALEQFEDDMLVHLHGFSPRHAEVIGDDWLRRVIALGVERARAYGVTDVGLLRFYVELMFMFGGAFDTDPLQPWAGEILRDPAILDQETRVDRLYDASIAYLDAVDGPDSAFSIRAMRALLAVLRDGDAVPRLRVEDVALETIARVHPERFAYLGEPPIRALVRRGPEAAARLDLGTDEGIALTTGLMFAMGHGFADDPLYPWVQATLRDPAIKGPERRAARLRRRVGIYLDRAIGYFDGRPADGQG